MIKNRTTTQSAVGLVAALLFVGIIIFANWITTSSEMLPVGFGLHAVPGTMFIGFVIATRDIIQDTLGRWWIVALIVVGTAISFSMSAPEIAFASAAAFGFGELMNFAVYTPLRTRSTLGDKRWALAVASSNVAASLIDSVLFVVIAFGVHVIVQFAAGQFVGKLYATGIYLVLGYVISRVRSHYRQHPREVSHA